MGWRKVKRRFGIAAPRLSVRPHVAWYLRWGMTLPFVLAALALAWFAYDSGLELAGFNRGQTQQELVALRAKVSGLRDENLALNKKIAEYEQQLQIEQGRGNETARQLKLLNDQVAQLQEDLAFFQNLTASQGKAGGVAIHRLVLERDQLPGEYRVRMLLVQGGQRVTEFAGGYQIVASVVQDGRKSTRIYPQDASGNARYPLNFKYYQRLEQGVKLPVDAQLKNIQVRVFEQGAREPGVRQSASL